MGHGRFSDLYNPHWGRNVENASFLWDGGVGEVDGSAASNGTDFELFASTSKELEWKCNESFDFRVKQSSDFTVA